MSSNLNLFLQNNFISRFSRIFGVFFFFFNQNTRKAGSHYQTLLIYAFKSFHDMSASDYESDRGSGVSCATNQQTRDQLCETRAAAHDQRRDNVGDLRSLTVRILQDTLMARSTGRSCGNSIGKTAAAVSPCFIQLILFVRRSDFKE